MFFHFHIPVDDQDSHSAFADFSGQAELEGVLKVSSTRWFDTRREDHRGIIVSHILALIRWADEGLLNEGLA